MMVRSIILDWDGTLIDARPRSLTTFRLVLARQGVSVNDEEASILFSGTVAAALSHFGITGQRARAAAIDYQTRYMEGASAQVMFFPGVLHALRFWHSRGVRLAVATSKVADLVWADDPRGQALSMMDAVIGDGMCASKPSGESVVMALQATGGVASQSVVLGDSPTDVLAGRAAGCRIVGAAYGFFPLGVASAQPDRVATSPHGAFRGVNELLGIGK
jgi:pyrophosphatase PpaX